MRYALALVLAAGLMVGCSDKKKEEPVKSNTVLDATPAPAPAPTVAPMPADTTVAPAAMGSSYVVKQGDTLYSIAKAKYGDGKQWTRIQSANPGVTPQTLKVGQKLTLP